MADRHRQRRDSQQVLKVSGGSWLEQLAKAFPGTSHYFFAVALNTTVQENHLAAERCEFRSAAGTSAASHFDQGAAKPGVQRFDERPGAHVGHAHFFGGSSEAPGLGNPFQKVDAPRTEGGFAMAQDAQAREKED